MKYCDIGSSRIAYEIFGSGSKTVVIDTAISSCSAEWWDIARKLGTKYRVLVYDRAGYGTSSLSSIKRTPENISEELHKLIDILEIQDGIILLGHSQGGLYAVEYALKYPKGIEGLILLDPATPFDNEFQTGLSPDEYKKSGIDKSKTYKIAYRITSLGLGFALKPLLKKSPPFYYSEFPAEEKGYILKSLCNKNTYKTAIEEYEFTHSGTYSEDIIKAVKNQSLGNIPVRLITHSTSIYINELKKFGGLSTETAEKIEGLWQGIMKKFLDLSFNSKHTIANNSGHYIHLTDSKLLFEVVDEFIQ